MTEQGESMSDGPDTVRRPTHCGRCGEPGHNRRTCGRRGLHPDETLPDYLNVERCRPAKTTGRVFIGWIRQTPEVWEGVVHFLHDFNGVRVYDRDLYDARCDLAREGNPRLNPLPYFTNEAEALEYMLATRGAPGMCQVDTSLAHNMGLDSSPEVYHPLTAAQRRFGNSIIKGPAVRSDRAERLTDTDPTCEPGADSVCNEQGADHE